MKIFPRSLILTVCAVVLAVATAGRANGQTAQRATASAATPRYDASKEIAVEGTVASILSTPTAGLLAGAHALVATSSGTVDAHLGNYALKGANPLVLTAGQHVRLVGVMAAVRGRPVLLVRTVQTGGGVYTVRNAHGFPLRSGSASATRPQKDAKGERP